MHDEALVLDDISFSYKATPVLSHVSLAIRRGEFVTLVGPSGSGKSTIFRMIAGLLPITSGSIRLYGGGSPGPGRVGYMPQRDCLLPWRTVTENAAVALEARGVSPRAARMQAAAHLDEFGLGHVANALPTQLSGGMRQRVAFLRTVLGGHDLLLLDEPFGALDAITRATMQQWLLNLWGKLQKTVLFITHDAEEAVLLSDRVYALTGKPVSGALEVTVGLPRPRHYDLVTGADFQAKRRLLLDALGHPGSTEVTTC